MNTSGKTPPTPKFQVTPNWKLMLFSLFFLPVLIGLGTWQLQRAEEKKTIQESWQRQQALPPVPFEDVKDAPDSHNRRVSAHGSFDSEHYWLVENRILDGQLGYEVLMPFVIQGAKQTQSQVIIVNRGWLPAGAYRAQLPSVNTPDDPVRITGALVVPSDNRFIRRQSASLPTDSVEWPSRILQADLELLGEQLGLAGYRTPLYNRVLRLDEESTGAFHINWRPTNMSPNKHRGYAVQWFSMALALLILSIFANSNLSEILSIRKRQ